jgi:hypothetical protein
VSKENESLEMTNGEHKYFRPAANAVARLVIVGTVAILLVVGVVTFEIFKSPFVTRAGIVELQPVPFSHKHHVTDDGIDCRYCHTTVEKSAFAGMPSTETCMNCHSQIWTTSEMLEPVRASFRTGQPLHWTRVHNLQQFAYFNHSIHVTKGVGCATCHGRVDQMSLTYQEAPLTMEWCISCHREPQNYIRPKEEIFNMEWSRPENEPQMGTELVRQYQIKDSRSLTNCSTCHR